MCPVVEIGAGQFTKILPPLKGIVGPHSRSSIDQTVLMLQVNRITTVARGNQCQELLNKSNLEGTLGLFDSE